MNDALLMGLIAAGCILATSIFWVIFNTQRIFDLKLEHVEDMQEQNQEIIDLRQELRDNAIRDRTMSAMPIGRLIKDKVVDAQVQAAMGEPPAAEMVGIEHLIGGNDE